jgi:hypothetical protein
VSIAASEVRTGVTIATSDFASACGGLSTSTAGNVALAAMTAGGVGTTVSGSSSITDAPFMGLFE